MTYSLHFLPEVEEDAINGYRWYQAKSPGLGEEFLRVFYAAASGIVRNPQSYPKIFDEFRRCLLRRFPYAVYFMVKGKQVIVFGLFHCARDPHMVKTKLRKREGM